MLLLRLLITPLAVLAASAAQRRFGPTVGGRIIALPLTTGPFLLLLGMQSGSTATAHAAAGVVFGELSVAAFCACYGLLARREGVRSALTTSVVVALLCSALAVLGHGLAIWLAAPMVIGTCVAFAVMQRPAGDRSGVRARTARAWEVPVRMVLTTAIVATLLGLSTVLGPVVAGTLSTLPVILSVMIPATHVSDGPGAATAIARGTLITLPATTASVCVVSLGLVPLGPLVAVGLALLALIAIDLAAVNAIGTYDKRVAPAPV